MAEDLKDFRGKRISRGACIVYAVKQSTTVKMVEAIIDRIDYKRDNPWSPTSTFHPVLVVRPTRRGNSNYEKYRKYPTVAISNLANVIVLVEAQ